LAVLDLDAHFGDGTYALAKDDPAIAIFDVSQGTWVTVAPDDRHEFYDVEDVEAYRAALERLPAFLDRTQPGLVQYQAGMDPYYDDPVGGIPGVDAEFLRFRDQFVLGHLVHRGIPVVVNIAGGYLEDGTSERLHVETIRVAAETLRRHRTRELCRFDPATGILKDEALHAELLGDDTAEWDLDLTPCENMSDDQIDRYIEDHIKRHYGRNPAPKPDRQQ
jgi:acetoin utilization deacetylase AcuC-like enzyme